VSAGGISCGEAEYPAGLALSEHVHENASVTVVLSGSFEESGRAALRSRCEPGTVVARPPAEPHADRIGERGVCNLEIEFDRSFAEASGLVGVLVAPFTCTDPMLRVTARRIRAEMRRGGPVPSLVLEGLALELIGAALPRVASAGAASPPPRWLARVRDRLESGFRDDLRIGRLAAEAGVHPVHLARAFRSRFGISPAAYVRRRRIEWVAVNLLSRPDRSITEVALEAGFCDHSHFARAFRAAMGMTPSEYRARHAH
jgi:AraC family transcriptional regulator